MQLHGIFLHWALAPSHLKSRVGGPVLIIIFHIFVFSISNKKSRLRRTKSKSFYACLNLW